MPRHLFVVVLSLIGFGFISPVLADDGPSVAPATLTCEYLTTPLGIDVTNPRLSWILKPLVERRGLRQTAYQILVASSADSLAKDRGDLWDSGRVESDRSIQVSYAGKPLQSFDRCYWKVRVWDADGKASEWSEPSLWSMGILKPGQWQGTWISYTGAEPGQTKPLETSPAANLRNAWWIWYPEGNPREDAPVGMRYFRRRFNVKDAPLLEASVAITADDRFTLYVNGHKVGASEEGAFAWKKPKWFDIKKWLHPGENVLAVETGNDEPGPAGLSMWITVITDPYERHEFSVSEAFKTSTVGEEGWEKPEFDDSKWKPSKSLGRMGTAPWGKLELAVHKDWVQKTPAPMFRKTFDVSKPVRQATAYVTGLGYYEFRLNGAKVGDRVLDPAFTDYSRRVLYATYDVTKSLTQGKNALGILLGNGWYNMHARAVWDFDHAPWRNWPTARLHLRVEYKDGSVETIVTDDSWKASFGPLVRDSIRSGEVYDARLEQPGWATADFDAAEWKPVEVVKGPEGLLHSEMIRPMRITETLAPKKISQPKPGMWVFDIGQNMAGWVRLQVSGKAGTKVQIRYAERINEDGTINVDSIAAHMRGTPFQTDVYILKGDGVETWRPRFVYHGFQYVEVTGLPSEPTAETIQAEVVHTDFPTAGSFTCSNEMFNKIQTMTLWSYRGNFHGYPTDCPHREKNGWMGDAHLAAEQAMYNFENAPGYLKWLWDIQDSQKKDGQLPGIVPTSGWGFSWGNGPAWDSAFILIPWYLHVYRDDQRAMEEHYAAMKRYVDYVEARSPGRLADFGLGDWVPANTETPRIVTSTGYFYVDCVLVSQFATLLGKDEDAKHYAALAKEVYDAFNKKFYKGKGVYANNSQTALSCALYQGLVPPSEKAAVLARLGESVTRADDHIDTGILGAKYLFHSLSRGGMHDKAFRVATQTTRPSYGRWIERGATTLWEDWDEGSSRNHIMFGDISAWFYQTLAGMNADPKQPAFKHLILRPRPVGDITWVKASHESQYGPVKSGWQLKGGEFVWNITIPVNTSATIYVPCEDPAKITERGETADFTFLRVEGKDAVFNVPSGSYEFHCPAR